MKRTPFYSVHRELGAQMVPFAGFEMPLQYEGIIAEHLWVREKAGLFDVSHMGEFIVRGPRAEEFVAYVTSNDPGKLPPMAAQYSLFLNEAGGIVDDLLVYRLEDHFMLVVNAANIEKDFAWISRFRFSSGIELENRSDEIAELALQGPRAEEVLQPLVDLDLSGLDYFHAARATLLDRPVLISRTGYTGEDGFEIYLDAENAEPVFFRLLENPLVKPVGLGARDTLRLEMGYPLYGNDITDETNPFEARLGWVVRMKKPDFVGKAALEWIRQEGIRRRRVGFQTQDRRAIPRPHQAILHDHERIGEVTSGTFSPSLKQGIGMGYVPVEYSDEGTPLQIEIRGRAFPAQVVSLPFYRHGTVRSHRK